mmetsp:Transcript_9729/g.23481  ORF Transcript_9729/g.23481 Transcript_9729/m.23481 type:complete len:1206 (-) Transcript_9729:362-3979(-)
MSDDDPWSDDEKVREAEEDLRKAGLQTWSTLPELGARRTSLSKGVTGRISGGGGGSHQRVAQGKAAASSCGGGRLQLKHANSAARRSQSPAHRTLRTENVTLSTLEGLEDFDAVLDRTPGGGKRLRMLTSTTAIASPLKRTRVVQNEPVTLASEGCGLRVEAEGVEGLLDVQLKGPGMDPREEVLADVNYKTDHMGFEGLFFERRSDWVMEGVDLSAVTLREVAKQSKTRQSGAHALESWIRPSDARYFCGGEGSIIPSLRGLNADDEIQVARSCIEEVATFSNMRSMPPGGRKGGFCVTMMMETAPECLRTLKTDDNAIDLHRHCQANEVRLGKRVLAMPQISSPLLKPAAQGAAEKVSVCEGACDTLGGAGRKEVEENQEEQEERGAPRAQEWDTMPSRATVSDVAAGAPIGPFQTLRVGDDIGEIEVAVSRQIQRPSAGLHDIKVAPIIHHPDLAACPNALPPLQHSKNQMSLPPVELSSIEGAAAGDLEANISAVAAAPRSLAALSTHTKGTGAPGEMLAAGRARSKPSDITLNAEDATDASLVAIRMIEDGKWEAFEVMEVKESPSTSVSRDAASMDRLDFEPAQRLDDDVAVDLMEEVEGDAEEMQRPLSTAGGGGTASDTAHEHSEVSQLSFAATAAVSATVEDDLESFMKLRGIDANAPARSSVSAAAASLTEIPENDDRSMTKIRVEISQDSPLSKQIYDIKCLTTAILLKLEEQQVVKGHGAVKPDYLLAIAHNVRSQIEKSNCTISSTQLVMTWSAIMSVYVLTKLGDQLVRQGPMAALAFFASACEDEKWDTVLSAVLGSIKKELIDGLEDLCKDAEHPYWPALDAKVKNAMVSYEGLKPAVLVKSSLMFDSVSRALYGNSYRVRYFKTGSTSELIETLQGEEICVIVLTEQALLECDPSHYSAVSVLYHLQPPIPGVELLVNCFKKVTRIEVIEPRIEPMLIETGAMGFRDALQVEVKTEDLWVDSNEELCGGALLHRSVKIKLFANNDVMQMRNVLLMLEQENIATVERPLMKPDLSLGNMCIVIRDVEDLCTPAQDNAGNSMNELLLFILELSLAFSHIVLLLEQRLDQDDRVAGPSLTSDEWVMLHGIAGSYGVHCLVREVFSNRQLAVEIRAAVELCCGLEAEEEEETGSGPAKSLMSSTRDPNSFCSRQHLVAFTEKSAPVFEEETDLEILLASFPSLSSSAAQTVL